jgi:type VI secretion system protein ImpF
MSRLISGGAVPLFDKLGQRSDSSDHSSDQVLAIAGVEASVAQELNRLTNSRSRVALTDFEQANLSVLDYGIPDYSARSAQSESDRSLIARAITRAIQVFEPRLSEVEVELVQGYSANTIALYRIGASLRVANNVQRVNFNLATGAYPQTGSAAEST